MRTATRPQWRVPTGLILLSMVPVAAGAVRLTQLAGGATVTPKNERFFDSPVPVVVHIISVTVFALLGAFQFAPRLRQHGRRWHRTAGRLVAPFGLAASVSGLWMALFYKIVPADHILTKSFRLAAGVGMATSLVLGVNAIRSRDFERHRSWMMRGYALGLGAGTQVFTALPWMLVSGETPTGISFAMVMGAGWVINLVVVEWLLRRRKRPARSEPGILPRISQAAS